MILAGPALAAMISRCAPGVRPSTVEAIIRVESGGEKYALNDNTSGRRYFPATASSAVTLLTKLVDQGHQVDAGLMQIDTENFAKYGLTPSTVFNVCTNIKTGAAIFRDGYVRAKNAGFSGQPAVFHAFEAYNSGRLFGDAGYANSVFRATGLPIQISSGVYKIIYHHLPKKSWSGSPFSAAWNPGAGGSGKKMKRETFATDWHVK